jgi:hypothetical protein
VNPVLERLRADYKEGMRPKPPSPPRTSMFRLIENGRAYNYEGWPRYNQRTMEEKVFPELVRQVRENFMMDVRFSRPQLHMFVDWFERTTPLNVHVVSHRSWQGTLKGPGGKDIYSHCYIVRLMDIHWMWLEMA